jgi:recombination protein RecT
MSTQRPASTLARPDRPEQVSNAVAQRDPNQPPAPRFQDVRDKFIGQVNAGIVQALGKGVDAGQFTRSLATVINENPKLLQANQVSLAVAVLHAARLGLDLTPSLQLAFLAPFNVRQQINGKWTNVPMVKMMIGYKGFVLLARRSGLCEKVDARAVYERDIFEWEEGTSPLIKHKPLMGAQRGEVIAAYCRAKVKGDMEFRVVDLPELEKAHRASNGAFEKGQGYKPDFTKPRADSAWTTHFAEMCEKTAIRRFFKGFDLTEFRSVAAAIELEDAYDLGKRIPAPSALGGEPVKPPPQLSESDEWGDDVLYGNRDEGDEDHETIVEATASGGD